MRLIKFALKELLGAPRLVLFFSFNVAIGLSGLMLLENLKLTFNKKLESRSKNLLGADLSLGGRRPVILKKRNYVRQLIEAEEEINIVGLYSMARGAERSKLVYLKEYHPKLPFYGGLLLRSGARAPGAVLKDDEVFVYPELLLQLDAKIGDQLKIGESSFRIADIVEEDSSQTFQLGSIAPKLYITRTGIDRAQLIKKGSTAYYSTYYKTLINVDEPLVKKINDYLDDNSVKVVTPEESSFQVGRVINYLSDFLGLVSLVALFLAFIGIFYLYRSYLSSKRIPFAIMKSLGFRSKEILWSQCYGLLFLSLLGTSLGIVLCSGGLPLAVKMIKEFLQIDLVVKIYGPSLFFTSAIGVLGVLFLGVPLVMEILEDRPSELFQEGSEISSKKRKLIRFLPLFLFYGLLCIWIGHSLKVGLLFITVLAAIFIIFFPFLHFLLGRLESRIRVSKLEYTLSLRYLARYRVSTISIFLALFFGAMLINFIPTLQKSIQKEIEGGNSGPTPSLFLFDVQEEQVNNLKAFVKDSSQDLLGLSPMVRGRLTAVNEKNFKVENKKMLTREGQRDQRFRNRGINLTYKVELNEDEDIVEGSPLKPFSGEGLPGISLEKRYAKRLGLKLGDVLTFDIAGLEEKGRVENFRRVRWTSFRPNFFISFSSGVLEDFPKTFLGVIPRMNPQMKANFQLNLVREFPNVSAVDLDRIIRKIKEIMGQMSIALTVMSVTVIAVGMMVVFALVNHQINERKKDLILLKVLGMNFNSLRRMVLSEFFFLSFFSTLLGSFMGILLAFIFSSILFEGLWTLDLSTPLVAIFGITSICLLVTYISSYRALKRKAAPFLAS